MSVNFMLHDGIVTKEKCLLIERSIKASTI